jgi:sulfite exporter TauE/SafE
VEVDSTCLRLGYCWDGLPCMFIYMMLHSSERHMLI